MEYSLGLYEKALPPAEDLVSLCRKAREAGFDRLELSIDESDARLARLEWSESAQRELGIRSREAGTAIRTLCLSGHRKYPLGAREPAVRARSSVTLWPYFTAAFCRLPISGYRPSQGEFTSRTQAMAFSTVSMKGVSMVSKARITPASAAQAVP